MGLARTPAGKRPSCGHGVEVRRGPRLAQPLLAAAPVVPTARVPQAQQMLEREWGSSASRGRTPLFASASVSTSWASCSLPLPRSLPHCGLRGQRTREDPHVPLLERKQRSGPGPLRHLPEHTCSPRDVPHAWRQPSRQVSLHSGHLKTFPSHLRAAHLGCGRPQSLHVVPNNDNSSSILRYPEQVSRRRFQD